MSFLCEVCDRQIIEIQIIESDYKKYITTLRKKNDKSLYKKDTINNVNLDEFDEKTFDCITTHNKKFDFYFSNCEFKTEFDINFTTNMKTTYFNRIDSDYTKSYLLYYIDCFKSRGYKFQKINQMTINSISDRSNMTYKYYMDQPMSMCEKKNMNIAKNPQLINLLDRNKNYSLIRKNILVYNLITNKCIEQTLLIMII